MAREFDAATEVRSWIPRRSIQATALSEFNALGEAIPLASLDCTLALAEVFDKVELPTR